VAGEPAVKETFFAANRKYIVPGVATLVGFGMIALFAALSHRPSSNQVSTIPDVALHATPAAGAPPPQSSSPSSLPTDQNKAQQPTDQASVSPSAIQGTASPTLGSKTQPLGEVQSFQQPADAGAGANKLWAAPAYALAPGGGAGGGAGGQESNELASARLSQVSKPSLVFVLSAATAGGEAGQAHVAPTSTAEESAITNLGYQPGDHITTHLEAVATTATKAPVIAVVDYTYKRNGVTVIPAGTRIIGTIGQASSTGIMDIQFSSLHLPNGEDVAISAMALNTQMGALKGTVTGRNRSKQFLMATMAGLGATTALFAGNNNTTGTLSEGDMIRSQAAQNMGQAADSGISQLSVTEHLIVTVPAGTQVEVTFMTPAKPKKPTQL
jgi:hypothetical protein